MKSYDGSTPILRTVGVSKTYRVDGRDVQALADYSLDLGPRDSLAVVGGSGSGKSTLARLIMGLEDPSSGDLWLHGRQLSPRRTKEDRRRIQIVFQDPRGSLNPRLSVLFSVLDYCTVQRIGDRSDRMDRAREALASVGIDSAMSRRRPSELSGGQLQRVCIARALVVEPEILVADEPTSALDVSVQGQILNELDRLRDRLSILLISHDMRVVRFLCERVSVLQEGREVEAGSMRDVLSAPRSDYTADLMDAAGF
jgi:ABC-type glutathione transport system ATPase component